MLAFYPVFQHNTPRLVVTLKRLPLPAACCFSFEGFSEVDQTVFGLYWTDSDLSGTCPDTDPDCNQATWRIATPDVNSADLDIAANFLQTTPTKPDYVIIVTYNKARERAKPPLWGLTREQSLKLDTACAVLLWHVPSTAMPPCMHALYVTPQQFGDVCGGVGRDVHHRVLKSTSHVLWVPADRLL
jgi:hypothetical protein